MDKALKTKTILLVITGGIAAYKSLELIRLLRKNGAKVRAILTKGGAQFVTPLSVSALCEEEVFTDLWSLKDETEMGHIRLSREADLIIIAPASADFLAKMAHGKADDLASTTLLAANKPILFAPAMNHKMWENNATHDNLQKLHARGMSQIGPEEGDMACGEYGPGRMSPPESILQSVLDYFYKRPLKGLHALVTAGPTHEPIDPVRYIGNRSSGRQGYAIAAALELAGAHVTLISGPVNLPAPPNVDVIYIETAAQMLKACKNALPADMAICTAAVSDWAPQAQAKNKIKKQKDLPPPAIALTENPDILQTLCMDKDRPPLMIGFAAETNDLEKNAKAKIQRKKCDWILANDVSNQKVFGKPENHVHFITKHTHEDWKECPKAEIARRLVEKIIEYHDQ
ncbi:MAG: bifunctional phosphopantothenoylcysteine decarboxylase/phosphopantothenate--cysteine ligase CoaBC [Micavibrio sp.]|nr:bifunctional phosphopantothenoylcysteine decarboxylase/phosphopantothenate--cysteine ligase CoaBC [Micavibrio sp.]